LKKGGGESFGERTNCNSSAERGGFIGAETAKGSVIGDLEGRKRGEIWEEGNEMKHGTRKKRSTFPLPVKEKDY